jgi:hypothetical protein
MLVLLQNKKHVSIITKQIHVSIINMLVLLQNKYMLVL